MRHRNNIIEILYCIGGIVTEDPELWLAIFAAKGVNATHFGAEPGKCAARASQCVRWVFFRDDGSENEVDAFDCVSMPVGVTRDIRNIGDGPAYGHSRRNRGGLGDWTEAETGHENRFQRSGKHRRGGGVTRTAT